ncbi:MAG: CHASE2 domain-containing protein [Chloroflexi bacterium]|nr:CHASE2 domain-containing protein [Chloroflexota bacterium]
MKRIPARVTERIARLARDRRVQNRLQVGSALALGVGLLLSATLLTGIFNPFQARFSDLLYRPRPPSGQVVLVEIDSQSIAELGPWPWPRLTFANLINTLAAAEPRVVALETILAEPSADDPMLAQALARIPRVIQPVVGVDAARLAPNSNAVPRFNAALVSSPALRTLDTEFGHTWITADEDGIVRRIPAAIEISGRRYLALGIAALAPSRTPGPDLKDGHIAISNTRVPIDNQGRLFLKFTDPRARETVSGSDLVLGRIKPARLRDKIVLIGLADPALREMFETPLTVGERGTYPVEIQADLIETLLDNRGLVEQDRLNQITMIFLMALLAGATLPHVRFLSAAALTILYFLAYLGYAFAKFGDGVLVQPLYPALAMFLTFVCAMIFRYFAEDRERDVIERLFRRYVAPETLAQVLAVFDRGHLVLGGTRREVTLLYVDLRELATLTEIVPAEALVKLLNQHVAQIESVIFQSAGFIAKQTGDTILAVWNLPLAQSDHAHCAVHAALEIKQEIVKIQAEHPKELELRVGMGLATGAAIAGHIRTRHCVEYVIIGQVVAVAERLAMNYDRAILIDAATLKQIGDDLPTQQAKPMRLRGATEAIPVWQVSEPMQLEPITGIKPATMEEE